MLPSSPLKGLNFKWTCCILCVLSFYLFMLNSASLERNFSTEFFRTSLSKKEKIHLRWAMVVKCMLCLLHLSSSPSLSCCSCFSLCREATGNVEEKNNIKLCRTNCVLLGEKCLKITQWTERHEEEIWEIIDVSMIYVLLLSIFANLKENLDTFW